MQAVEAMQRLIAMSDELLGLHPSQRPANENKEQDEVAIAIIQAMLNTALPVARYRAFVEVDQDQPKRSKFQERVAVRDEYTVCGVTMASLISGLVGITHVVTNVKVTVFEQRADGADMISGYQGQTKGKAEWARFLRGLTALESMPTVQ